MGEKEFSKKYSLVKVVSVKMLHGPLHFQTHKVCVGQVGSLGLMGKVKIGEMDGQGALNNPVL